MAKKKKEKETTEETAHPSDVGQSRCTPEPPKPLSLTLKKIEAGTVLHRVHPDKYSAGQFNPGVRGNARFSPIQDDKGNPVPTMYAGSTMDCALMETVFHDVPHTAGMKTLAKNKLERLVHSQIAITQDLCLVSLASVPLRKMGIRKSDLIETEKDKYPDTRKVAKGIRDQNTEVQGFMWVSRQDDEAYAYVLFGDRIPDGVIVQRGSGADVLEQSTYDKVIDLAIRLDVMIVDD